MTINMIKEGTGGAKNKKNVLTCGLWCGTIIVGIGHGLWYEQNKLV